MSLKDALLNWIFKNARIPKPILVGIIDKIDVDQDGYIDLAELTAVLKGAWDYIRKHQ